MKLTLIGHSTVLLESRGTRVLIDPFFGRGNLAYRRTAPPAVERSAVGPVDGVLVSHTHFDHFDGRYLHFLPASVPVYIAAAARAWGTIKARRRLLPLRAWETVAVGPLEIAAVPARHLGPTVGFVIRDAERSVYFAGDTYLGSFMAEIHARYRPQVCLLPVSTFLIPLTMGNRSAVQATRRLAPRTVIPIHLGIVPRSPLLRRKEDARSFRERVEAAGLRTEIRILAPGESYEW